MKNYIVFVNDHSGSMGTIRKAAIADYNASIAAVKDAASAEMLDTVVSVNRKLVGGTGVIYWKEVGVPFTEADLAYLQPKAAPAAPAVPPVLTLPQVPVSNRPTKSPIPVTPQFQFFETREDARRFAGANGIKQSDILRNPTAIKGRQWSIPTKLIKQAVTA